MYPKYLTTYKYTCGVGNFLSYAVFTWGINIQVLNHPVLQVEEAVVYCVGLIMSTLQSVCGSCGSQEQYTFLSVVICGLA
jgi:hypothetical protein